MRGAMARATGSGAREQMQFVIDGYNLMHALGMAPKPGGLSLERARLRFTDWVAVEAGPRVGDVCVVFDAKNKRGQAEQSHRGLRIRFSLGQTADDLIEEWVRDEAVPSQLTIVSNDHRLQQAAQRRRCVAWDCGRFIDWLGADRTAPAPLAPARLDEKPATPSQDEVDEWLRRFEKRP
jgi:uncharacterized protein